MQDIARVCKKQRQKERKKQCNNSSQERLRTHKAHIRPFDNQTLASCKILHVSFKFRDRKKGRYTVIIHYVNVSVLIKFILPTFDNQTLASCKILHLSVKTRDERRKHSNKSCRERLRTHEAHISSFDIQTSA